MDIKEMTFEELEELAIEYYKRRGELRNEYYYNPKRNSKRALNNVQKELDKLTWEIYRRNYKIESIWIGVGDSDNVLLF